MPDSRYTGIRTVRAVDPLTELVARRRQFRQQESISVQRTDLTLWQHLTQQQPTDD